MWHCIQEIIFFLIFFYFDTDHTRNKFLEINVISVTMLYEGI